MSGATTKEIDMNIKDLVRPVPSPTKGELERDTLADYRDVAAAVGVVNPQLVIDDFKHFLEGADLPVFDLANVAKFGA